MLEYAERGGRLRINDSCGEQSGPHKLDGEVTFLLAVAVVNPCLVNTCYVDDGEVVVECRFWVRTVLAGWVPELYANTEVFERCRLKVALNPSLLEA